ncbi:hypothetical protein BYT27DRAFT_7199005 [Phlegmacium glaucopus]|nr:hypothetical protein BYT27DRAFT_7199005 [Phlegmacium glaucopus]
MSSDKLRTSAEETVDTVTCSLCRRQFAKYTCPACNAPYCSLTCFRSQAHNRCSERFYKKEIEIDIHAEPSKNAQERQKMMDLLKKFEEESNADQTLPVGYGEGDEDPSDLVRRFGAVDLDSTTPDALWAMLTSTERSKFITALNNPTGELAQRLLASEALEKEIQQPWWEVYRSSKNDSQIKKDLSHNATPRMMEVPMSMINSNSTGHPLLYNICAILISYAYVTRHLGVSPLCSLPHRDPEYSEARRLISRLVPFLTDRKSTKLYPNLTAISTEIWSAFDLGVMTNGLFALLLRDAGSLLTPLLLTELTTLPSSTVWLETMVHSHPYGMAVLALSDLHDMFSIECAQDGDEERTGRRKGNHITHKLIFYAAHLLSTPSAIQRTLVQEMMDEAEIISPDSGKSGLCNR